MRQGDLRKALPGEPHAGRPSGLRDRPASRSGASGPRSPSRTAERRDLAENRDADIIDLSAHVSPPAQARGAAVVGTTAVGELRCVSITTEAAFLALEPQWQELFASSSSPSPFHSWAFVVEWWRHFVLGRIGGATGRFEIVQALDAGGRTVALLPFYFENNLGHRALGTTLQPFGRSNSAEAMTDEPVALYRCEFEAAAVAAVKAHLCRARDGRGWDITALRGNPGVERVARVSPRFSGTASNVEVTRACPAPMEVSLASSWDCYRATLSKSMRDNIAYYPKRLSRHFSNWAVRAHRSPVEIAAATEILIALHRKRSQANTGVPHNDHIATADQASFLRRWFERAANRGEIPI